MTRLAYRERGILMSGDNPRLLLADKKTQTRRICKIDPLDGFDNANCEENLELCPYGAVGDRLYVRETHWRYGKWVKNGRTKTGRQAWTFKSIGRRVIHDNDHPPAKIERTKEGWHKRPSIFMPKWATRIWLEILKVRIERLQDISEMDAMAEGVTFFPIISHESGYRSGYQRLWNLLHGKGSWDLNEWVWVLDTKRLTT